VDNLDIWLPNSIKELIDGKSFEVNKVGMSDSSVYMFDDMVLKIQNHSRETDNEYTACQWLSQRIPTPRILVYEVVDEKAYCLMSRVKGRMACDEIYMNDPELLLEIITKALQLLWSVDISDCPCIQNLDVKLDMARFNVENDLVDVDNAEPDTFGKEGFKDPQELLKWLEDNRPDEDLVFTHGDFCLPNIFAEDSNITGFIDLGRMGVADKWQDIALCYRSLKHNFEGKYNGGYYYDGFSPNMLFEKLGIEVDQKKLRYYILLDELF
jgi:aminoglycoside phosphotransferase